MDFLRKAGGKFNRGWTWLRQKVSPFVPAMGEAFPQYRDLFHDIGMMMPAGDRLAQLGGAFEEGNVEDEDIPKLSELRNATEGASRAIKRLKGGDPGPRKRRKS